MTQSPPRSHEATTGIASIGLSLPPLAMQVEELAGLRNAEPEKYTIGLGCREMSLCPPEIGVVEMAVDAARRALGRWNGDLSQIGMIAVGTESAVDMSRPVSAWVADALGLQGAVRSYEVKHACYGGTLALRQAVEWRLSGAARGQAALVIAADVALYEEGDPGEPTQGAGAVAMIVDEPKVAAIDPVSFPWSEPQFDFWRPVGADYPKVDGPLSLDCYQRAAAECFAALVADRGGEAGEVTADLAAACFHVPFPKMVKKAVLQVGERFGWSEEETGRFFDDKVEPTMPWNRLCGNAYTASLWIAVAYTLAGLETGREIAAFSYGSGFGAELLLLKAGPDAAAGAWRADVEADLSARSLVDADTYVQLRT